MLVDVAAEHRDILSTLSPENCNMWELMGFQEGWDVAWGPAAGMNNPDLWSST